MNINDVEVAAFKKPLAPIEVNAAIFLHKKLGQQFFIEADPAALKLQIVWVAAKYFDDFRRKFVILENGIAAGHEKFLIVTIDPKFVDQFDCGRDDPLFHSSLEWHAHESDAGRILFTACSHDEKNNFMQIGSGKLKTMCVIIYISMHNRIIRKSAKKHYKKLQTIKPG